MPAGDSRTDAERWYAEEEAHAARHAAREVRAGITWGSVMLGGYPLRAYRDNAQQTISYLRPPANWQTASYHLAQTFVEDGASDDRTMGNADFWEGQA